MRAPAATMLAVLLAVLAAGCGGGGGSRERTDYVQALNRAQSGLAQRFGALGRRITPTSTPAQDARTLGAYEGAVRVAIADLRSVRPPSDLRDLHARLVAGVAEYGAALRRARAELRGTDPQKILAAQGRLRTTIADAGRRLNATIQAINGRLES
ncbi:hypothetical protein FSW04_06780 [Baekduia soli]|uniref:Lipoprotein n=1 Tax=Baekduia soli TaxID=496014 RepID=A0A5B8U2Y2_9ACTN|nr:hypothetical protein [Baekduia soli]QEC47318.1 hypothetical protein FSW04_06780 [Baekduia soli]